MTARMRGWAALAFLVAIVAQCVAHGAAAPVPETLGSFQHTAFTKLAGAPGDVSSLLQDADGFLWMTATKGIVRFDGVNFQPYMLLPSQVYQQAQVTYIHAAEGGGIWMDSDTAGPTLARDGRLTVYGEDKGFQGTKERFYAGPAGRLRAVSTKGINEFVDGRWRLIVPSDPGRRISGGAIDPEGHEWVVQGQRLYVRATQDAPFTPVDGVPDTIRKIAVGDSGRLYLQMPDVVRVYRRTGTRLTESTQPLAVPAARGILETRSGALWLTTTGGVRYASAAAMAAAEVDHGVVAFEFFTKADGLTGGYAWPVLEDREGNVWVGTEAGLDLFQRTAFNAVSLPESIHEVSVAADLSGRLWLGSENMPIQYGRPPGAWTSHPEAGLLTLALARDPQRDVAWAINFDGLWRLSDGHVTLAAPFPYPKGSGVSDCVTTDARGRVYICPSGAGYIPKMWDGARWNDLPALPEAAKTAVVDAKGTLWMGVRVKPMLARFKEGKLDILGTKDGLATGPVKALQPDGDGLWVGGDEGVQYFDGTRFLSLPLARKDALAWTTGIVVDDAGHLWIQTLDGVLRSRMTGVAASLAAGNGLVGFDLFTQRDGLPGAPDPDRTLPTLRKGPDGRLWAQTASGLAWVDPSRLRQSQTPPAPRIDSVMTSHGSHLLGGQVMTLAADEHEVRIAYTAPALSRPDLVHFAYRLVGLSDRWEDVGNRREATFTNLPPGRFRFEVRAVNAQGLATEAAILSFDRKPGVFESWWFRSLLVVPVFALMWLAYELRTRSITRKIRIRAEEREAVARDIHDTLLQRFQGLTLTMQAWSTNEAIPEKQRAEMLVLADEARAALVEGRERILALRGTMDHGLGLYNELSAEGRRLAEVHGMAFGVMIAGTPRPLRGEIHAELRDIGIEAMRNAFGHSGGARVEVSVSYEDHDLWLVVADDGHGIDESALAQAPYQGHFGLVGLRERAARLRGTVRVDTAPGEGTEIHVRVPGRTAYASGM